MRMSWLSKKRWRMLPSVVKLSNFSGQSSKFFTTCNQRRFTLCMFSSPFIFTFSITIIGIDAAEFYKL